MKTKKQLEIELAELRSAVTNFLTKYDVVKPYIDGMFQNNFVRSGRQYSGPSYGVEIDTLKKVMEAK